MKIFVGSSTEQRATAEKIKEILQERFCGQPVQFVTWEEWFADSRHNNRPTWAILTDAFIEMNMAIMLLANDDDATIRQNDYSITRDNVLIETGAFAASVGIENVFLLTDGSNSHRVPSDLLGLNYILYNYDDQERNATVYNTICNKITTLLKSPGSPSPAKTIPAKGKGPQIVQMVQKKE